MSTLEPDVPKINCSEGTSMWNNFVSIRNWLTKSSDDKVDYTHKT